MHRRTPPFPLPPSPSGNFKFAVSGSAGRLLASRQLLSYLTRVTKNFYIRARRALRRQLKYLGGIAARLRARAGVARIKGVKFSVSGPQRILKRRLMEEGRGDAAIKRTGAIRDGLKPDRAR